MKRIWILLLMMTCIVSGSRAEMQVFAARDALGESEARQIVALLADAFPQEQWTLVMEGEESLEELVLLDRAPQLALCMTQTAIRWAKEGLLLPLTHEVKGMERIQKEALVCCQYGEALYMAPLCARIRQMAVNPNMFEKKRLGYLLSEVEHPVWYATQMYQIMEEFMLGGGTAFEIWPPYERSAGIEALVQAIGGGELMSPDGTAVHLSSEAVYSGVKWLWDMVRSGMAGYAKSREAALERFLNEETAIFIDWTQETQDACEQRIRDSGIQLKTVPYPSVSGEMTRVFSVMGAAAFDAQDEEKNALALHAAAFLGEDDRARAIAGGYPIGRDEARWLPELQAHEGGMTLRAMFAGALGAVLEEEADVEEALLTAEAAMEAVMEASGW